MPVHVKLSMDTRRAESWFRTLRKKHPELMDELLGKSGDLLAKTMRERAPVRSGFLRDSITIRKAKTQVKVGPTASYASFVEFGTKPHIIEPVHASVLAFEVGGQTIFAKRVQHPGFPGRFFVKGTGEECLPEIRQLILDCWKMLFRGEA